MVGRIPTRPHTPEGRRMEPPVSVPREAREVALATEAAEPPLEPQQNRAGSQGLWAAPNIGESVVAPWANSCMTVFPMMTAPAAFSRRTTTASSVG